jgi:hypothetical protein
MDEVLNIASRMRQVNDDQAANLKGVAQEIYMMQKGLSGLARQVYQMIEGKDKQKHYLTDLQTYMERWGAMEEDATRQLQMGMGKEI